MTETATTPDAPAVVEEETFEVVLSDEDLEPTPEGEEPDEPKPEAEPTPEPKVEPKPAEPKAATPKPEPEPEPAKPERTRLDPIAREERAKRKEYARRYAEASERADAAERRIQLLTAQPDPKADDPALQKWHRDLLEEAKKVTDLDQLLVLSMREMDRREQAARLRERERTKELNAHIYQQQCDMAEVRARQQHPDWEDQIKAAGLFEAISTNDKGEFRDPTLGRRVYYNVDGSLAADPAERLYRLAVGKLEYERALKGDPDEPEPEPPKAKAKAAETPKPEVEAERRGAQRVVEQVSKNANRLKGIRQVPNAGAPQRWSRTQLDELMRDNPAAYDAMIRKHPALERFHLEG